MDTPDTYWDLFFGYSAIWLIFVLFLLRLVREQAALKSEIQQTAAQLSGQPVAPVNEAEKAM